MGISKEVTITLVCDAEDHKHDFISGGGVEEFVDTSKAKALKQAIDEGWMFFTKGIPESKDCCICPDCVKRKRGTQ